MQRLRDIVEYALSYDDEEPRGPTAVPSHSVLLCGPPGSGKSYCVGHLAEEIDVKCLTFTATDIYSHFQPDEPKTAFHPLLISAARWPRVIAVIDHISLLFPSEEAGKDFDLVKQFVDVLQDLADSKFPNVILVCTTTATETMDQAVRAKFEEEIYIGLPSFEERLEAMAAAAAEHPALGQVTRADLAELNALCGGYTVPQALALLRDGLLAAALPLPPAPVREPDPAVPLATLQYLAAQRRVRLPGANSLEIPRVEFSDIIGLEDVKARLLETVVWPSKYRTEYATMDIQPSSGILLYGVPGTGKTMLAKATATQLQANFIPVHIADLIHGEVGESEQALAEVFRVARAHAPCIVFLDELQAMFTARGADNAQDSKLISQLFLEMDLLATAQGVVVLGATNLPAMLDPSLLAAGRMDIHLHVPPPNVQERAALLRHYLARTLRQADGAGLGAAVADVAAATERFTGADLASLCNSAALAAYHRQQAEDQDGGSSLLEITATDLQDALATVTPSVTPAMLADLLQWRRTA